MPSIVPFYVCAYLFVRIIFEHLFFTKSGRKVFGFNPNLDVESENAPVRSLWKRVVTGGRLNQINQHYLELYPLNIKVSGIEFI